MFQTTQLLQAVIMQEGGQSGPGMWDLLIQIGLILAIFYFLLIRPNQKRAKAHQNLLKNLKRDDEVVTTGGIYGRITGLTDTVVTLEIAQNVRIKVQRSQIAGLKGEQQKPEKKDNGK